MSRPVRVLLLSDTHVGHDDPVRPRVERRRRGPDFLANFARAIAPALAGHCDLVVHGGDLLDRSRVPPSRVQAALAPLIAAADRGVPVFLVPGNHERSAIPHRLLASHPGLRVFDRPGTGRLVVRGARVAVSGFPCERGNVRARFPRLVAATGWRDEPADLRLLCMHQAVEGARVGVQDFTFRRGADVVRGADLPAGFAAVLSGHIHRHQVLRAGLAGRPLPAPVVYPGSVERTAFQEREETKGFALLDFEPGDGGGRLAGLAFRPLPARPMVVATVEVGGLGAQALRSRLGDLFASLHPDGVVCLRLEGEPAPGGAAAFGAAALRALAPPTMNVTLARPGAGRPAKLET